MSSIFARINIAERKSKVLSLNNIDFSKNVQYLKEEIGRQISFESTKINLIYNGIPLDDATSLEEAIQPNGFVFCFSKTNKYEPEKVETPTEEDKRRVHELFRPKHIQISIHSRVNILQKILKEYPEFRFNLGAHALIRDSVLFNTVHLPEVIDNLAKHYPIICKAAPFIVETIKKEFKKNTSSSNLSEPTTDTTSEDENSLGASSSSERNANETNNGENSRSNQVSRQQLQSALAYAIAASAPGSNIMPMGNSSGEASNLTADQVRTQLQRAMETIERRAEAMHAETTAANDVAMTEESNADDTGDVIPAHYRSHQYAEQLRTMAQMGFLNYEENLTYLNVSNGNIEHAVNLLMGIMN